MALGFVTLDDVKIFLGIPLTDTSQDAQLTMFIGDVTEIFKNFLRGRRLQQDTYTEFYQGNGTRFVVLKQRPVQAILNVWLDYNGYYGQGVNPDGTLPFAETTRQLPGTYDLVLDDEIDGPPPAVWNTGPYLPGDTVASGGLIFTCIAASTNNVPPDPRFWSPSLAKIPVSKSGLLARVNWAWPDIGAIYIPGNLTREGGQFLGNLKIQYLAGYPPGFMPGDLQYAARLQISIMRATAARGVRFQSESDAVTGYSYSLATPQAGEAPEIGSIRQILTRYREVPGMGGDLSALPSNNTSGAWR